MDPQQLRTFVEVVTAGSFSAAARTLGYTQSAVSQQIAALESDLGVVLLHRRPSVAVTEAGARLLEHATPLLLRLSAARADVTRAAGMPRELLTIAVHPLAVDRLATMLGQVRLDLPRLEVRVVVAGTAAVATAVARGDVDLGVAVGLATSGDPLRLPEVGPIRAVGIAEEPPAVVLPADHPLAGRPDVRLADLVDAAWIDAPEAGCELVLLRMLTSEQRLRARLRMNGPDVQGLLALVAAGHGLTLLPPRMLPPERTSLVAVPIRAAAPATRGARMRSRAGGLAAGGAAVTFRQELLSTARPGPAALAVATALGGI
ncbi:LysR family transcriptional regulator [Frankia sp. R82]|uniref:LysR family transcriptional regulator n=1 Tax=Frankia sp. R82 TaxID=2950553 RepID=UPI0020435816|nr:LysR family transcriptional regulator [Frankia sp. R82]MCM3883582.1 LysR family transcriptional regulator [Frankia sp. R82]